MTLYLDSIVIVCGMVVIIIASQCSHVFLTILAGIMEFCIKIKIAFLCTEFFFFQKDGFCGFHCLYAARVYLNVTQFLNRSRILKLSENGYQACIDNRLPNVTFSLFKNCFLTGNASV